MHAVPPSARQPIAWSECSSVVQYDFNSVAASVVPVLEKLFALPDFHALVLSGDVDAIVPVSGTLLWIESLNRTVIKPWHVW
jgi:serine carboxypeptidase-like clade 2